MTNTVLKQGFVAGVFTAALSAASQAVPDTGLPFHDLYVGVGAAPGATVTETATNPSGASTGYKWQGSKDNGIQVAVTSLNGRAYRWGGWVWGAEVALGLYDITPTGYEIGSASFVNDSNTSLNYRSLGINVLGGYEYGIMKEDGLRAFLMVLPHVGFGAAMADTELRSGSAYTKDHGFGYYGEYGLRLMGCITERSWIGGISIGFVRSTAKVKVTVDPYESDLTLKRSGVTFGAMAGYRF
jgi:hypothetical protein